MTEVTDCTYTVQKGDCAWKAAKKNLQASGKTVKNADIIKEMNRLAKLNGCESVDDFNNKFFSKIGLSFIIKGNDTISDQSKTTQNLTVSSDSVITKPDSLPVDSTRIKKTALPAAENDSTGQKNDVVNNKNDFNSKSKYINSIKGNQNRVIAYNKEYGDSNYVIVDKKTCTATVYSKDGQPLKSYEVIVGASIGDDLSTAYAADKDLQISGRRTVPGEYKLGKRSSTFGGMRILGDLNEVFDPDVEKRKDAPGSKGTRALGATALAMHATANPKVRNKYYNNGTLNDNRQSMGCVNIPLDDLNEMEKEYGIGTNSKVYILPEIKDNELILTKQKDGTVKFITKYKDKAQNEKVKKIQDSIADKNIAQQKKKKAEEEKLLAQQKAKQETESKFCWYKPNTWFS